MSLSPMRFPVAVIMQRSPLANRWASERWEPVAVLPAADGAAAEPERIADGTTGTRWRFAGHVLELHRTEAEGYFLNVSAPEPKVFVMWRTVDGDAQPPVRPEIVSVSYNEAARMLDGGERVDAVPMAAEVRAWLDPFVALHYKPEPRRKVRRNDPFADDARKPGRASRD